MTRVRIDGWIMAKGMRYLPLVGAAVIGLVLLGYVMTTTCWDGSTDLMIEFVVTDAETGMPIEGAEILVYDELNPPADGINLGSKPIGTEPPLYSFRIRCARARRAHWVSPTRAPSAFPFG